jgi:tetratricopeptide (TPR) repeat protein
MSAVAWPSHAAYDVATKREVIDEARLLTDAADGTLDEHSLVEAALLAGSLQLNSEIKTCLATFAEIAADCDAIIRPELSDREKALAIHAFLHNQVLHTYRTDASDVAEPLSSGEYNCVSGSVLFVALAQRHGLHAHAVQLPEHVRCELIADGVAMPIEMTSHNPSAGKAIHKRMRPLSDVTLLATLYYNRGVAAFDRGDLPTAIEMNQQALQLDPDCRPAKENLLAAINNRVVELMKANAKFEALKLLEHGLGIEPGYRPFQVNRAYLMQRS